MVTKKLKNSDSIDDTVKLLNKILQENQDTQESKGEGKKIKIVQGAEIISQLPPKIPLELPSDYFSDLELNKLKKKKREWQAERNASFATFEESLKKFDDLDASSENMKKGSSSDEQMRQWNTMMKKKGSLNDQMRHWKTRTEQIDFLLGELNEAIWVLEPNVLVSDLSIEKAVGVKYSSWKIKTSTWVFFRS